MDDILTQSLIEKVDGQEKRISEMQTAINNISNVSEQIESLKSEVLRLNSSVNNMSFPIKEMRELTKPMEILRNQLSEPVNSTVTHHHHFPRKFWVTAGLVIALIVVSIGLYRNWTALENYKANDTKYRFLKLRGNESLHKLLFVTDSLYRVDPGMRDSVLWREQVMQDQFKLQQRIKEKEEEIKQLKKQQAPAEVGKDNKKAIADTATAFRKRK